MTTPRQPRLVVLGDLLLDIVISPERPIQRGTDVPGRIAFRRGGSAANVAAAFVHAGGRATLITSLGDDRLGSRLAASLRADGVRVRAVRHAAPSGRLAALVDGAGERSFVTQRGAADLLSPGDLPATAHPAHLLVPRWTGCAARMSSTCRPTPSSRSPSGRPPCTPRPCAHEAGTLVSADLSSRGPLLSFGVRRARQRLARLAPTVLFANRDEAAAMLHESGRRAWPGLLALAPLVVLKDGARGCRVLWRDAATDAVRQLDVEAQRVGRADTTGAGDAFAAGFLFTLVAAAGEPIGWRLRRSCPPAACLGARRTGRPRGRRGCPAAGSPGGRAVVSRARPPGSALRCWAMSPTTDR